MKSRSTVRVRYAETDQMGVVYHANFLAFFEVARTDYFRHYGFTYKQLEQDGVRMPVTECYCRYDSSAYYDDVLEIACELEMISRLKLKFSYEVLRKPDGQRIAEGFTTHVPVNTEGKPCRIPTAYRHAFDPAGIGKQE